MWVLTHIVLPISDCNRMFFVLDWYILDVITRGLNFNTVCRPTGGLTIDYWTRNLATD